MKRRHTGMSILVSSVIWLCNSGCQVGVGDRVPDWTLTDINGRTHTFSSYKGRVVVLDFWATWCPPCMAVSPHMQAIQKKYVDRGVAVLAVHYDNEGEPKRYMKQHRYTFTALEDGYEVARKLGVSKIPTIMVVGPDGRVAYRQTGFANGDEKRIMRVINKLLAG